MGTMNNGGGTGGFGGPNGFGAGERQNGQGQSGGNVQPSEPGAVPDNVGGVQPEQQPDNMPSEQGGPPAGRQPPGGGSEDDFSPSGSQAPSGAQQSSVIALGASILVLAAGLLIAFKFKR